MHNNRQRLHPYKSTFNIHTYTMTYLGRIKDCFLVKVPTYKTNTSRQKESNTIIEYNSVYNIQLQTSIHTLKCSNNNLKVLKSRLKHGKQY